MLYIKSYFNSELLEDFTLMLPDLETVSAEFSTHGNRYIVGNFYRLSNGCVDSFLFEVANNMHEIVRIYSQHQVFLMGDFNIDLFKMAQTLDFTIIIL